MQNNSLFFLLQNSGLSAIALQSFVLGYYNVAKHKKDRHSYPKLGYLFYVLPIVYNESACNTIKTSTQLYTALKSNKEIILGLQERAYKMAGQTFSAINIGFCKKILTLNKETGTVELLKGFQMKRIPLPLSMNTPENDVRRIQDSAHRLGGIFAKRSEINLQLELNIRF